MCVLPDNKYTRVLTWPLGSVFIKPDAPQAVAPPQMPQSAKQPDIGAPLKRKPIGGPLPAPAGGTLLTGSSGIADAALLLGGTGLLGGGKG